MKSAILHGSIRKSIDSEANPEAVFSKTSLFKNEDNKETKRLIIDLITSEVEEEICGINAGIINFTP